MKRKYKFIILIINITLIFSIPLVRADLKLSHTPDWVVDSVNDVAAVNINEHYWNPTNLHPELEILTMGRLFFSWNYTITFNSTIITGVGYYYSLGLYERFEDGYKYEVIFSPGFDGYLLGPDGYWNGSDWESNILHAVSIVNISGNTLDINIPTAAHNWSFPQDWAFSAMYNNSLMDSAYIYLDACPDDIQDIILAQLTGTTPQPLIWPYIVIPISIGVPVVIAISFLVYKRKKK